MVEMPLFGQRREPRVVRMVKGLALGITSIETSLQLLKLLSIMIQPSTKVVKSGVTLGPSMPWRPRSTAAPGSTGPPVGLGSPEVI